MDGNARDEDEGRTVGSAGIGQDATDRKSTEEALRETEERYSLALAAGRTVVWDWDVRANEVSFDRAASESPPYRDQAPPYHPDYLITRVHPDDRDLVLAAVQAHLEGREAEFRAEYRVVEEDGSVRWEVVRGTAVRDTAGEPYRMLGTVVDISDRKLAEQALRESKERYLAIFEQAADSLVLIGPDTGALVEFNDRAHLGLGYTRSEFETLTIADFEVLESAEQVAAHLHRILQKGSDIFETKHRTKAGEIRDIQVNSKTISAGGREFVQSIWRDITEQKRAGEALKRAHDELENRVRLRTAELTSANQKLRQEIAERERAEQALRESERRRMEAEKLAATGRLAARVAHEINNPLAGILNCLQLVKAAVGEGHRHYEYAELIEKEIDRIGRIVRQMLQVHRPDQETVQDVHVAETIEQVVAILAPNCRDRRLRVETRADPSEITIRIPEGSLRQILYNLLANAVEASPPGGTIKIGASTVDGGNAVEITVADPGEGIPEDVQDRIFEPFFTTKEGGPSGNVGLGLSISKGIIDSLGGVLDFGTTPGAGTTFRVVLPSTDR